MIATRAPPPTADHDLNPKETSMNRQSDRVAKMETKAFPPPLQRVVIVSDDGIGVFGPAPDDLGPDDMIITVVGVEPAQGVSP